MICCEDMMHAGKAALITTLVAICVFLLMKLDKSNDSQAEAQQAPQQEVVPELLSKEEPPSSIERGAPYNLPAPSQHDARTDPTAEELPRVEGALPNQQSALDLDAAAEELEELAEIFANCPELDSSRSMQRYLVMADRSLNQDSISPEIHDVMAEAMAKLSSMMRSEAEGSPCWP
ncbi:MAG: hypothetical protein KTR31_16690 [Myxococcales bacterium]|nr:hypothetical protein [Myxococcales bacterium]